MIEEKLPIIKFSAATAVALEFGMYAAPQLRDAFIGSLKGMRRKERRIAILDYDKQWGHLMATMKRFAKVMESDNPEFYDSAVDRLTEVINSEVQITITDGKEEENTRV